MISAGRLQADELYSRQPIDSIASIVLWENCPLQSVRQLSKAPCCCMFGVFNHIHASPVSVS